MVVPFEGLKFSTKQLKRGDNIISSSANKIAGRDKRIAIIFMIEIAPGLRYKSFFFSFILMGCVLFCCYLEDHGNQNC